MEYKTLSAFLALFAVATVASLPLPSYLSKCKLNDASLSDCELQSFRKGFSSLVKGDKKYNVPVLDPLRVSEIKIGTPNSGLAIKLTDVDVHGLEDLYIEDVKVNSSLGVYVTISIPKFKIVGKYEIDGKILVLEIKGNGDVNLELDDLRAELTTQFDRIKNKDDGLEYIKPGKVNVEYTPKNFHIQMDNLFNGDKKLGDNLNKYINENWADVNNELKPDISRVISEIFGSILERIFKLVPIDEVFD